MINFRPVCCLALVVVAEIALGMAAWWLLPVGGLVIIGVAVMVRKIPRPFCRVLIIVYLAVAASFLFTTWCNPHPYLRTYDVNAGLRGMVIRKVTQYLTRFMAAENVALFVAMLFGTKSRLTWGTKYQFNLAGIAHLLVVSGLHVMLIAGALEKILTWCRCSRRQQGYVILPVLLFYAYLCGWQYAVLRALIMWAVFYFARQGCYHADHLTVLATAVVIILIIFPYALVSPSFVLSCSCLGGLILCLRPLSKICPVPVVRTYLAVTIGSLPCVIYWFQRLTLIGLLCNVVLVPVLVGCFYMGIVAVCTGLGGALLWIVNGLLHGVNSLLANLTAVPGLVFAGHTVAVGILIYWLALLFSTRFVRLRPAVKYSIAGVLFGCYLVLLVV